MPWRRTERATIRVDPCDPSPEFLRDCFAAVFASLDERPRRLLVDVYAENESGAEALMSFVDGNPVFVVEGRGVCAADFRRRWIAEHPVPLVFRKKGATRLLMVPADENRVKVRRVYGLLQKSFGRMKTALWTAWRGSQAMSSLMCRLRSVARK